MKMQPFLIRGLSLATAALLFACSGTQQGTETTELDDVTTGTGTGMQGEGARGDAPSAMQDPDLQMSPSSVGSS